MFYPLTLCTLQIVFMIIMIMVWAYIKRKKIIIILPLGLTLLGGGMADVYKYPFPWRVIMPDIEELHRRWVPAVIIYIYVYLWLFGRHTGGVETTV